MNLTLCFKTVIITLSLLSVVSLITSRYYYRQLFINLEKVNIQAHKFDTDWRWLQLERARLERYTRISYLAHKKLEMIPITPNLTLYFSLSLTQESKGGL